MGDNLKQIRLLGEGAFGKCFLCENTKDNSLWVVKQIDISKMTPQEKREAYHEAKVMSAFDHPNIIKFKEVFTTTNGKLNIVMNYADGGDVQSKIKGQRGRLFSENEILDMFVQICLAIKHVHDRKVLHRDIKGQNIFLMKNGMIKLGDFGISKVLTSTMDKARTMIGTPYYLSPEIVEGRPYSFKSDVWSLGVLLYELCTLKPPFDGNSIRQLSLNICRGTYPPLPSHFSKELKNLVTVVLTLDPNKRPTVGQMLKMPFIQSRIKNALTESVRFQEFSHTIFHNQDLFSVQKKQSELKSREEELAKKKAKDEEDKKRFEARVKEEDKKREIEQKRLKEAEAKIKDEENRRREEEMRKKELENKKKQDLIKDLPRPLAHKREGSKEKPAEIIRPKLPEIPPFRPLEERKANEVNSSQAQEEKKNNEIPAYRAQEKRKLSEIPPYKPLEERQKAYEIPPYKPQDERQKINEIPPFRPPEDRLKNMDQGKIVPKPIEEKKNPAVCKPPSPALKYNPYIYQKIEEQVSDIKPAVIKQQPIKQEKDIKSKYDDLIKKREKEEQESNKKIDESQQQRELNAKKREDERKKMLKDIKKKKKNKNKNKNLQPIQWVGDIQCIVKPESLEQEQLLKALKEAVEESSEEENIIIEASVDEEEEDEIIEIEDKIGTEEIIVLDREKPELEDMRFFIENHLGKDETFKAYQILKGLGDVALDEKNFDIYWPRFHDFLNKGYASEFLPLLQTLIFLETYV
ncbi:hypothetical protein SteCoe_9841 [Stentor coeruleus]|uniref:non-specific serine/threonine protein kinase n=1 Tax=Stentor coeruleus TaxID=5963 RepID=A0A1R2CH21_9CILI|nr:hypothetical protein SteCoe_9841 [Stentor coeruleus]